MVVSCSFTFGEANYNSLPCRSKTNHERSTGLRYARKQNYVLRCGATMLKTKTQTSVLPFVLSVTLLCTLLSACTNVTTTTQSAKSLDKKLTAEQLIESLDLTGHVEGGFFRQTFKADHRPLISTETGDRVNMTSIYYLLSAQSPIGHFHMNRSDIMHYFHMGDPITYYLINQDGSLETHVLGPILRKATRCKWW